MINSVQANEENVLNEFCFLNCLVKYRCLMQYFLFHLQCLKQNEKIYVSNQQIFILLH